VLGGADQWADRLTRRVKRITSSASLTDCAKSHWLGKATVAHGAIDPHSCRAEPLAHFTRRPQILRICVAVSY